MKAYIPITFFIIIISSFLNAQTQYRFYINNINMPIDNKGVLADVNIPPDGYLGRYNGIGFLFSGGFYVSGYTNDSLWANGVATASLVNDYQSGIIGSDPGLPENKIYVVSVNDLPFGQSWEEWSDAVALGADFYDGDDDGIYDPVDKNGNGIWDPDEDKPDILGDLTAWCVFNDGVPAEQKRWGSEPQGIEIQQTVFGYHISNPLFSNTSNTIFIRYRLINKGTVAEKLDSVLFSLYSDFDIGTNYQQDLAACDTLLFGSYGYKAGSDPAFGNNPPSIFHHFNQFPHIYIPGETFIDINGNGIYDLNIDVPVDTAYSHRGPDLGIRIIPGAKNTRFISSVFYVGGFSPEFNDPGIISAARNNMLGFTGMGTQLNPCTNPLFSVFGGVDCSQVNPRFWASGDPVTNIGWISTSPRDMRTVFTAGPFDLVQNDFYDIIIAYTLGHGVDNINSITAARQNVIYTRWAYNSNFGQFPVSVDNKELVINDYRLFQNYPNPFNPITNLSFNIGHKSFVSLKVYDVLGREVAALVNEEKPAGNYEVVFNASHLASGVYFYSLETNGFLKTQKMILLR